MTIGEKIRALRKNEGYTLEKIANNVGVTPSTILKYEKGQINIPSDKIELLAQCLKTTPGYLMGWEPEKDIQSNTHIMYKIDVSDLKESDIENLKKELDYLTELVLNKYKK